MNSTSRSFVPMLKTIFAIVSILFSSSISIAQEQKEEQKSPEPIPTADIFQETEITESILTKSSKLLVPDKEIANIDEGLPEYFSDLDKLSEEMDPEKLDNFGTSKLNDLIQSWDLHHEKLNLWQIRISERSNTLESERNKLLELKEVWEVTLKNAISEKAPPEVLDRIKQIIKALKDTESLIRKNFGHLIALQNRISLRMGEIAKMTAHIKAKIDSKKAEAFTIDSEPLWGMFNKKDEEKSLSEIYFSSIDAHTATLKEFYLNYEGRIRIHILIFFVLLGILFMFRRFGNQLIIDKETAEISREVLNHPFSVAIFISLTLTSQMYPQAPNLISKLAQIASLMPILRLFPVLTIPKIKSNLSIFILLYFLKLLYVLSPEHTLNHRLLLLLISLSSIIFFVWVAKTGGIKKLSDKDPLVKYFAILIRITIPLMIIAFISNIVGNVVLASMLTVGSLTSVYAAIILLAAGLVIISLLNLLLSTKMAFFSRIIRVHSKLIIKNIARFIYYIALLFWVVTTLRQFNLLDLFTGWIISIFTERLQVGEVDISLGDVVVFFLTIYASIIISRFIRFVLKEDVFTRMRLPRGVPAAISMLANYSIVALGFMIALSAAGFDLNRFAILIGALGVGIGFGLQSIVNNFISGLVLIFERPVQVGDVIELPNLVGNVKRIGIRSSTIRTFDGSEVIVPNGNLISNEVTNWTLSDRLRRIQVNVGTAYGSNPEQVLNILKDIVTNNPDILDTPEPLILFEEFGDSSLNFNLRFWTANPDTWLRLRSEVSVQIFRAFKEHGIEIPFPQRDLHLKSADPSLLSEMAGTKKVIKSENIIKKKKSDDTKTAYKQESFPKKRSSKPAENLDGFGDDE